MKKMILLVTFLPALCFAGAANTELKCEATDKTVVIEGSVPGDTAEHFITVKANQQTAEFKAITEQVPPYNFVTNSIVVVVEDLKLGVYTVQANAEDGSAYLTIYAIPTTVKYKKIPHGQQSTFRANATVQIRKQGSTWEFERTQKQVNCTTKYQI